MGNQLAKESNQLRQRKAKYVLPPQQQPPPDERKGPQPVRHQVVIADRVAPLPLLSSTLNARRRTAKRGKGRDTQSLPSMHGDDDNDDYGQPLSSSVGSSSSSSSPGDRYASTMIVFDSAIAHAEHAAADIKQKQQPSRKNTWIYEYGKEKEYNRQLRQHYVLKQVFGGNAHVALHNPRDVLECACGTGLWALEMAQAYPHCKVVGMDIVPPTNEQSGLSHRSIPSNASYGYGDILAPLKYPDGHFDYVYQRDVAHIVPMHKWPSLIAEFHRILRVNGQLELVEYDLLFTNPGPVLALVNEWYRIAANTIGIDPDYVESLPDFLAAAGFGHIEVKVFHIPIGEWPSDPVQRQFGFLYKEQMKALFQSMKRWWLSELHVSEQEYDRVCAQALEEFEEFHGMAKWKILTATKKKA